MLVRGVGAVRDELPAWRDRLPGSPMVELVELYISAAQPLLPHAEHLLTAWRDAALPEPTTDEITYEARRLDTTAEQAEANLRFWNARHWEESSNPRYLWDDLHPAWARLGAVRSTMAAAVTGDTDY
ncbi:MAG: hypothetical protein JO362_16990 [Streptomycetaceae bacterium]|nr:hypothetical protein [Streptomycetaceae bacterium]